MLLGFSVIEVIVAVIIITLSIESADVLLLKSQDNQIDARQKLMLNMAELSIDGIHAHMPNNFCGISTQVVPSLVKVQQCECWNGSCQINLRAGKLQVELHV